MFAGDSKRRRLKTKQCAETGSRLSSFLADYPNKTVDVLLLNMAGVPEKDISERLDLTKNAVKIRRHYIRKQIKQYLQDEQ